MNICSRLALFFLFTLIFAASALAQSSQHSAKESNGVNRTEILFLGTSGGPPLHTDRSEPATLLIVDGHQYLIDCGIGTARRMVEASINSEQVKTIFFTHLHPDHVLGLADVMGNDFFKLVLAGSRQSIDIYGPPQTKALVDAAFQYIRVPFTVFAAEPGAFHDALVGKFSTPFVAHEIQQNGVVFEDGTIRVTAAENTHYALMSAKSRQTMKSYSYRIETPHGVIVFTGDTGPSEAVTALANGADVLVSAFQDFNRVTRTVEALAAQNHWPEERKAAFMAHFKTELLHDKDIGDIASKARVKAVVLYHYNPTDPASYVAAVKKYFAGPVLAPADLDRYCLASNGDSPDNSKVLSPCKD